MRKTRFIAMVLVVALMLVGAGYAAWSDQVFLKTTVRTGNFNMEVTKAGLRTGDNDSQNYAHNPPWSQYDWTHSGDIDIVNGNTVEVEFLDLYPGGVVHVDMTTTNKGTIPAKLKSIDVEFTGGNEELFNNLLAAVSWKADITGDGVQDKYGHVNELKFLYGVERTLEVETIEQLNDRNIVIEPGGWLSFDSNEEVEEDNCIRFMLNPEAGNEFQNKNCRFKVTFNWEQWSTTPGVDNRDTYGGDGDFGSPDE